MSKKKVIGSLTEGEKPIKYLDILYNDKECKGSLKLIEMDLNEGSKGDKIYLCYGNEEEEEEKKILQNYFLNFFEKKIFQNPIVDFFIYINELNEIPSNYECISKNLNIATTKGKNISLCFTRNYNTYALKSENEHNLTDNIAVLDIAIVHDPKSVITCPDDYEKINKGCNENGCDLNHKADGDYIYLCQKKVLLEKLGIKQNLINKFKIIYNNNNEKDYENLKLINANLNHGTDGNKMYLAYGYDPNEKLSPIVDFFIYIKGLNTLPEGYECDDNDLNNKAGEVIFIFVAKETIICQKKLLLIILNYPIVIQK